MTDPDGIAVLEALLDRFDLLERLRDSPAYVRDLVDETGHSRRTVSRALAELEEADLVARGDRGVELTTVGALALERFEWFLGDVEAIAAAGAALESLPREASVSPAVVAGCETVLGTESAPYRPVERLQRELGAATRIRALVPGLADSRDVSVLYEHVVTEGQPAELVVTDELFQTLREEFPREIDGMRQEAAFTMLVGGVAPYGLVLLEADRGAGESSEITVCVVLFDERGGVEAVLVNDTTAALEWAESRYRAHREKATERTAGLSPDPDGGMQARNELGGTAAMGRSLPVPLEREGFVRVDVEYFRDAPVADPATAWRTGLSLAEVHTGYAIDRYGGAGRGSETEGDDLATALTEGLAGESNAAVVVGPPGSGKSTICKQAACAWYDAGNPVLYREGDRGQSFRSVDELVTTATGIDGKTLVVVEDATRPTASAIFEVIDRVGDRDDVCVLLDAREQEWRDRDEESNVDLAVYVPSLAAADCERLVRQFARTTDHEVAVPADELWRSIRDETTTAGGATTNEMLRLTHRLATYADPLREGPTALEEDVAAVYNEFADDELVLSVCTLANALNVAGVGVDRGLLYALADDTFDAIDDALERLEGFVLFSRAGTDGEPDRYRTVHESWSAAFLAHLLDVEGGAPHRFGDVVSELLALADQPARRERIVSHLGGELAPFADDSRQWADETASAVFATARERATLAPLFGDGVTDTVVLPEACSDATVEAVPIWLGRAFLVGDFYERAERAFERLSAEPVESGAERLLGLAEVSLNRGETDDGIDRCQECLALLDGEERPTLRARAQRCLGDALSAQADYDAAEEHYHEALEAFRAVNDRRGTASVLRSLGQSATARGAYGRAGEYAKESFALSRELGDKRGEARSLETLGKIAWFKAEYDRAQEHHEGCLDRYRELGDRRGEAQSLSNLSSVAWGRGEFDRAREYIARSLEIYRDIGDRQGEAKCLHNLGAIATIQGAYDVAHDRYEEGLELFREIGNRQNEARVLNNLGEVASKRGEYDRAREYWERSLELKRAVGDSQGEAATLNNLGELACYRGEYARAREYHTRSLELKQNVGDQSGEAQSQLNLGTVAAFYGEWDRARERYERSLELYEEIGDQEGNGRALVQLGRVARRCGEDRARAALADGLALVDDAGATEVEVMAHTELAALAREDGAHERAEEHVAESLALGEEGDNPRERGLAQLERARLALARGELDAAYEAANGARETFIELTAVHYEGRATALLGEIAAARGDVGTARQRFEAALETFEQIDAFDDALAAVDALVSLADGEDEVDGQWLDRAGELAAAAPEAARERHRELIDRCC